MQQKIVYVNWIDFAIVEVRWRPVSENGSHFPQSSRSISQVKVKPFAIVNNTWQWLFAWILARMIWNFMARKCPPIPKVTLEDLSRQRALRGRVCCSSQLKLSLLLFSLSVPLDRQKRNLQLYLKLPHISLVGEGWRSGGGGGGLVSPAEEEDRRSYGKARGVTRMPAQWRWPGFILWVADERNAQRGDEIGVWRIAWSTSGAISGNHHLQGSFGAFAAK